MTDPIHPGQVVHVWDHFVLDLTSAGASVGRIKETGAMAFLSLYAIAHSPSLGTGHVALLAFDFGAGRHDLLLADDLIMARKMRDRLRSIGYTRSSLDVEPLEGRFSRRVGDGEMAFQIESERSRVVGKWSRLRQAFRMSAPAPELVADEDITAVFIEAEHGTLEVDGANLSADVHLDDSWMPKVGRALLASHAALAEVRVRPVSKSAAP